MTGKPASYCICVFWQDRLALRKHPLPHIFPQEIEGGLCAVDTSRGYRRKEKRAGNAKPGSPSSSAASERCQHRSHRRDSAGTWRGQPSELEDKRRSFMASDRGGNGAVAAAVAQRITVAERALLSRQVAQAGPPPQQTDHGGQSPRGFAPHSLGSLTRQLVQRS